MDIRNIKNIVGESRKITYDYSIEKSKSLMPGILAIDGNYSIIGEYDFECKSYVLNKNDCCLYEGSFYKDEIMIYETEFKNELDFYIHMFRNIHGICIFTKDILCANIKTPLQLYMDFVETKEVKLNGFFWGGFDEEGYSSSDFDFKLKDESHVSMNYPQRDSFNHCIFDDNGYCAIENFDPACIYHYNSSFFKLLNSIKKNDLDSHWKRKIW